VFAKFLFFINPDKKHRDAQSYIKLSFAALTKFSNFGTWIFRTILCEKPANFNNFSTLFSPFHLRVLVPPQAGLADELCTTINYFSKIVKCGSGLWIHFYFTNYALRIQKYLLTYRLHTQRSQVDFI